MRPERHAENEPEFGTPPAAADDLVELPRQYGNREAPGVEPSPERLSLQGVHHVGNANLARAVHRAGVTGCTQPDGLTTKRVFHEPFPNQGDDAARREVHVDREGAGSRTRPALQAGEQTSASGPRGDLLGPCGIRLPLELQFAAKLRPEPEEFQASHGTPRQR